MSDIRLIESEDVARDYGFAGVDAVIEHPEHGRLLVMDGYGGERELRGGAVRWEHGAVIKLHPTDTLGSLRKGAWSEATSLWAAMRNGYDDSRPVLQWPGSAIAGLAKAAGLV